jgi:tetratricopeptide (TPR) repeat protein
MAPYWVVLRSLGDPRWSEVPAEALALLEQQPPGPELVGVLTEVGRVEALVGRPEDAVRHAERALALADELGLGRSARTIGSRGLARAILGDPGGLDDMREALEIAVDAGQGRETSLLHNNLGVELVAFDGPAAALEVLQAGIAFAQARGLIEQANWTTSSTLYPLTDLGRFDEALEAAARVTEYLDVTEPSLELWGIRAAQARILTIRGRAAEATDWLEGLESSSSGSTDFIVIGLGASALVRAGTGDGPAAAALLNEIERSPGVRRNQYYSQFLPALVRTALSVGEPELADRLTTGVDRHPYFRHAVVAATAALQEAGGDFRVAAPTYADAVERWERFGVVPERAFALLGEGRCLVELNRSAEASSVLRAARAIFDELGAAPALAETDALLQKTIKASS